MGAPRRPPPTVNLVASPRLQPSQTGGDWRIRVTSDEKLSESRRSAEGKAGPDCWRRAPPGPTARSSASFATNTEHVAPSRCRGRPDCRHERRDDRPPRGHRMSRLAAALTSANRASSTAAGRTSIGASSSMRVLVPKSHAFAVFSSKASTIIRNIVPAAVRRHDEGLRNLVVQGHVTPAVRPQPRPPRAPAGRRAIGFGDRPSRARHRALMPYLAASALVKRATSGRTEASSVAPIRYKANSDRLSSTPLGPRSLRGHTGFAYIPTLGVCGSRNPVLSEPFALRDQPGAMGN